jgi:small-conductance mechanosensitive channel
MNRMPVQQHKTATRLLAAFLFAVLASVSFVSTTHAADFDLQAVRERLDTVRSIFDSAENSLKQDTLRDSDFVALRDKLNPLRAEVRARIGDLEQRYAEVQKRLGELGPAPKEDAPAEDARITAERGTQTKLLADLDSALKQARLLNVRGEQIADQLDAIRRSRFKERLLTRSESVLSPALWVNAARELPGEARALGNLLRDWKSHADENATSGTLLLAALIIAALIVAIFFVRRMLLRYLNRRARKGEVLQTRRSRDAYLAICHAAIDAAAPPFAAFAATDILSAFDLISPRIDRLTNGVLVSITIFSIGCGVARAMIEPAKRMLGFSTGSAYKLYHAATGAVAVVAAATLLFALHRELGATAPLRTATAALMALLVGICIARALMIRAEGDTGSSLPNFIRLLGWVAVGAIFIALAMGHINLAAFTAARLVDAAIIGGTGVLLLALIDSAFATGFAEEGTSRRRVASAIGINPARLDLLATITAGLLRALLIVVVLFLMIGGWRTSVTDVASMLDRFDLALTIGQSKLALGNLLLAIGLLIIGLVVTRIVHRWLIQTVLPRTRLDAGLQNSISTMFVYLGAIAATLLALAQIGINLQNIAFVAGALSVGIGFGLQSIVSNFVSGIILLAERPIRVGDIIEVKGASGYVRRISVRATEIETGDRANVIVPNSELISNVLTNWTHTNTTGGISVKVGVSYDCDPVAVRKILLDAASAHPQVLKSPAPSVLLRGFGPYALEFELFAVIGNIDISGTVKSDLYFAILQKFREARIEIPIPQQEYRLRADEPAALLQPAAPRAQKT